jgi:hypothetical protein
MRRKIQIRLLTAAAGSLFSAGAFLFLLPIAYGLIISFGPHPVFTAAMRSAPLLVLVHLAPGLFLAAAGVALALRLRRRSLTHTPS